MTIENMENNSALIESLLEKSTDYVRTSIELAKLKTLDMVADVVSTLIPHTIVFVIFMSFWFFLNLGLAFWLGEILGLIYYGFFIVAGLYGITAAILHFFMHKRIKKSVSDYIIKQLLK